MHDSNQNSIDPLTALPGELVRARTKAGLTISELHEKTRISRAVLLGYEKGRTRPGAREIRLLCEALKVTPNKLIYGTEDPFEKTPLYEAIGADSDVARVMKMMAFFQTLTRPEQDAILLLSSSIIAARHGESAIKDTTDAIEIAGEFFGGSVTEFAENIKNGVTDEQVNEMRKRVAAKKRT